MTRLGNFNDLENAEQKLIQKREEPSLPKREDRKKLESQAKFEKKLGKVNSGKVLDMSDRDKSDYYRAHGLDSLADNRDAIRRQHEGKGLSHRPSKLNSNNYDKLAERRKLDPTVAKDTKESFAKWSPEAKSDTKLRGEDVTIRHARPGEKMKVTHTDSEKASGIFVSKHSLGKTPAERKDFGALPPSNKANKETDVYLSKPQNVMTGKIAPQKQFEGVDGIPRRGGGEQIVTDGGYNRDAVKNIAERRK